MNTIPNRDDYKNYRVRAIDFHTHTGTDLSLAAQSERDHIASDVNSLLDSMDKAGIDISVTFNQPIPAGKHKEWNYSLAKELERYETGSESKLIHFAFLNPWNTDSPDLLEDLVTNHGVKGLKLHPLFDQYPEDLYGNKFNKIVGKETSHTFDVAQHYGIPVVVHSGWKVKVGSILELAKTFPQMQVGVLHMMAEEDYFQCSGYDNVFVETSYATHPRRIRQIVEKLGSERVVFGSDYAWSDQLVEKMKVLRLPLPDRDVENILYRNAERILKL